MLIVLCGYSKSGKDTVAAHLPGTRLAFADGMKELFCVAAGITLAHLEANKELYRPSLVEFGRKGRALNPSMWISPVDDIISRAWPHGEWKVTDCRYYNEAYWAIDTWRAQVFYIHREGVEAANDEERQSIDKLRYELNPPVIVNVENQPEKAAAEILALVRKAA